MQAFDGSLAGAMWLGDADAHRSKSNLADDPSRRDLSLLLAMGASRVSFDVPEGLLDALEARGQVARL